MKIILDTRREKKNKKYPVKLRVTYQRKVATYLTVFEFSIADYKKLNASHIREDLQSVKRKISEFEHAAVNAVNEIHPFNCKEFERDFVQGHPLIIQKKDKKLEFEVSEFQFDTQPYEKRFPILKEKHPGNDFISVTFLTYILRLLEEG